MEGAENGETDTKSYCHPNCYHRLSGITNLYDSQRSLIPILGLQNTFSRKQAMAFVPPETMGHSQAGFAADLLIFQDFAPA